MSDIFISGKDLKLFEIVYEGIWPVSFSTTYASVRILNLGSIGDPMDMTHIFDDVAATFPSRPVISVFGVDHIGMESFLCRRFEIKVAWDAGSINARAEVNISPVSTSQTVVPNKTVESGLESNWVLYVWNERDAAEVDGASSELIGGCELP